MTRRMSAGMQAYGIGRMLAGTRWSTEQYDIHAAIDRTLTFGENISNIKKQMGIQTRNRGMETIEQRKREQARERIHRQDTTRQTGRIQSERNREMDRKLQARRPGKRISADGHRYYERRENRSDRGKLL